MAASTPAHVTSGGRYPLSPSGPRAAAGRAGSVEGRDDLLAALLDDLDVPTAAALAEEHGGESARTLLSVLRLAS